MVREIMDAGAARHGAHVRAGRDDRSSWRTCPSRDGPRRRSPRSRRSGARLHYATMTPWPTWRSSARSSNRSASSGPGTPPVTPPDAALDRPVASTTAALDRKFRAIIRSTRARSSYIVDAVGDEGFRRFMAKEGFRAGGDEGAVMVEDRPGALPRSRLGSRGGPRVHGWRRRHLPRADDKAPRSAGGWAGDRDEVRDAVSIPVPDDPMAEDELFDTSARSPSTGRCTRASAVLGLHLGRRDGPRCGGGSAGSGLNMNAGGWRRPRPRPRSSCICAAGSRRRCSGSPEPRAESSPPAAPWRTSSR